MQIREKQLPEDRCRMLATQAVKLARSHDARVLVNSSAEIARQAGADGVHLTAAQLTRTTARPAFDLVGASCHDAAELAHAAAIGVDFVVLGPVLPTLSHPGMQFQRFNNYILHYFIGTA